MAWEPTAYLPYIGTDGQALADAARKAPSAPIPSCPEWDMTALVAHVGGVHHWVEHIVSTRSQEFVKRRSPTPEGPEAVLDWYEEGLAELLSALGQTDPDEPVWNWRDGVAAPAAFWFRRMAHETAIHRWDGQAGAGTPLPPAPLAEELAVDGIDEYLSFVGLWLARTPVEAMTGTLHLHATDTEGEWFLDLAPDHVEHRREHAKADTAIRGPVSDLLLWMVNRVPADWASFQIFGDRAILDRWRQLRF